MSQLLTISEIFAMACIPTVKLDALAIICSQENTKPMGRYYMGHGRFQGIMKAIIVASDSSPRIDSRSQMLLIFFNLYMRYFDNGSSPWSGDACASPESYDWNTFVTLFIEFCVSQQKKNLPLLNKNTVAWLDLIMDLVVINAAVVLSCQEKC